MAFFKKKKRLSKGQVTAEYLLLAVVLLMLTKLSFNQINRGGYLNDFVSGPNQYIARMLENGNWKIDLEQSRQAHPNQGARHSSWDP